MNSSLNRIYIILMIVFSVMTGSQLLAQRHDVDAIHLKNGDIYRGRLIPQADSGLVRLETLCYNELNFNLSDISLISREKDRHYTGSFSFRESRGGYFNITEIGLVIGSGYIEKNPVFSITTTNGYEFRNGLFAGGGTGLEFFEFPVVPVFLDCRWKYINRRLSPFVAFKTGYSFALEDPESFWNETYDARGGLFSIVGPGTTIWLKQGNGIEISFLYRYQRLKTVITNDWSGDQTELLKAYNRLEIRFGFLF